MKIGVCTLVFLTLFALISSARAEIATTSTTNTQGTTATVSTTSPTIEELTLQLAQLTELFNQLKVQMLGVKTEIRILREGIKEGSTGDDVKEIQEILASDHSIYPAGLKTGFFGPMTKEAVARFQQKFGLEVTGVIDAETRSALDTIIAQRKIEGKIPPGLLVAPGLKMKFEGRMKSHCEQVTASSTQATDCKRVIEKYKFKVDDKGRMKMKSKLEVKDEDSYSDNGI